MKTNLDNLIESISNEKSRGLALTTVKTTLPGTYRIIGQNNAKILPFLNWLKSEYKECLKLTALEYVLLEIYHGVGKYEYIARDESDDLFVYRRKPEKKGNFWENVSADDYMSVSYRMCAFIKWEDDEPYKISDILSCCEVVDNE